MSDHLDADEYAGPATLATDELELAVEVTLRSVFQPIDGRLHWYGRITADDRLAAECRSGSTVRLTTPPGNTAIGKVSDVDPWGRFRIQGTGRPPF